MRLRHSSRPVNGSQQSAIGGIHNGNLRTASKRCWCLHGVPPFSVAHEFFRNKFFHNLFCMKFCNVFIRERNFYRCSQHVCAQNKRISRVEYVLLKRAVKKGFRVVHQIRVQWIIPSNKRSQGTLTTTSRTARLLPKRCDSAGIARNYHRIQPSDINA